MSLNPRYVTRPPKAGKRRERKYPPSPIVGKPSTPLFESQFKPIIDMTNLALRGIDK